MASSERQSPAGRVEQQHILAISDALVPFGLRLKACHQLLKRTSRAVAEASVPSKALAWRAKAWSKGARSFASRQSLHSFIVPCIHAVAAACRRGQCALVDISESD
jgi:hypothetical protein